jgi:hypothetical protein
MAEREGFEQPGGVLAGWNADALGNRAYMDLIAIDLPEVMAIVGAAAGQCRQAYICGDRADYLISMVLSVDEH